jgi:hypothetical protein
VKKSEKVYFWGFLSNLDQIPLHLPKKSVIFRIFTIFAVFFCPK